MYGFSRVLSAQARAHPQSATPKANVQAHSLCVAPILHARCQTIPQCFPRAQGLLVRLGHHRTECGSLFPQMSCLWSPVWLALPKAAGQMSTQEEELAASLQGWAALVVVTDPLAEPLHLTLHVTTVMRIPGVPACGDGTCPLGVTQGCLVFFCRRVPPTPGSLCSYTGSCLALKEAPYTTQWAGGEKGCGQHRPEVLKQLPRERSGLIVLLLLRRTLWSNNQHASGAGHHSALGKPAGWRRGSRLAHYGSDYSSTKPEVWTSGPLSFPSGHSGTFILSGPCHN